MDTWFSSILILDLRGDFRKYWNLLCTARIYFHSICTFFFNV